MIIFRIFSFLGGGVMWVKMCIRDREDSFRYYAEAMELLKQCDEQIGTVEKQVQMLDENGEKHEFE